MNNILILIFFCTRSIPNTIQNIDIQYAAKASEEIYSSSLSPGKYITGTRLRIVEIFHEQLTNNGQGIRVMIADSGDKRFIVYRGTQG